MSVFKLLPPPLALLFVAAEIEAGVCKMQTNVNCYLALGEVENASLHFMKCLQSGPDVCVDRKLLLEASEGLEKAQGKEREKLGKRIVEYGCG
ncbi:unnamed protein product [Ilex paraguariensis]|uniref:Uncharacterized protein n=1 Tax=Ilex paraguariensis TaxID=185542 RepID=A0ABC8V4E8_9AQUA